MRQVGRSQSAASEYPAMGSTGRLLDEMDPTLRSRMLTYYDERAPDYEQAYTEGTGTSSIEDRRVLTSEAERLSSVVQTFGTGHLIDLACGTGYWLPHYASRCTHITMIDQSANMLGECERRVRALGIVDIVTLLQGDVLDHPFAAERYDAALIGFLVSHLNQEQEHLLFDTLCRILRPGGRFLILDSAWTELRARFNVKEGTQVRRLNDGTEFEIYKRYLDMKDIATWSECHRVETHIEYFGTALFGVRGHFA